MASLGIAPKVSDRSWRCTKMERASREVWAKRVERWHVGGLTAEEFAAELECLAEQSDVLEMEASPA
jgi:hypothetical protein